MMHADAAHTEPGAPRPRVLFLTDRGERHQASALQAAPPALDVIIRRSPDWPTLASLLPDIEYLITERNQAVTAEMVRLAPRLKHIVRLGSLRHDIDLDATHAAGIGVTLQPVLGVIYCAEHALMMMLTVRKRLGRSLAAALAAEHGQAPRRTDEDTFAFNWLGYSDIGSLYGRTVGILGMGEIGVELARRLRPLGLRALLYHKRMPYPLVVEAELGAEYASAQACISQADLLVSLLPYAEETDYRRGGGLRAEALATMKPGAELVHLGSGSTLDEGALLVALREGRLAGAALDTYEYEPLPADHPLVQFARQPGSNLLLTPHTAAASAPGDRADDYAAILAHMARAAAR